MLKKIFKAKKKVRKEPKKKLPEIDYDGMGDFTRFGQP